MPAASRPCWSSATAPTVPNLRSFRGGAGSILLSMAGVLLMALIGNGFNILNVNPFFKDLTTGVIIVLAVALAATGNRR